MLTLELFLFVVAAIIFLVIGFFIGKLIGRLNANRTWEKNLPAIRADAAKRSRAVLSGQFSEQLAPYLPDFKWNPSEVKFLGKPIDFLVFKGLDQKNISEVVFVEVKSGKSRLSSVERSLKEAVLDKRVSWQEYRIDENITRKK